jgi:serine/tyrosine/threonine adenylyltransferase
MTAADTLVEFDNSYARALPSLSVPWSAAPAPAPQLLVLNDDLADALGLDAAALRAPAGVSLLLGHGLPDGTTPVAQAYAGHQFGGYVPRLGDGRALLLGEVVDRLGRRRDLHLKGSGRTPFARGGDGKAAVGPMLREYLMGEAMHALGIPTTRGLSVVTTGERVLRERGPLPGAVLCRVAASHLRVGTFQYAAASGDRDLLRALADHAIARHHPAAADAADPYLELYRAVVAAQAELIARWMLVGFVHGVMNTDNTTISGETIDYGPCAFLDTYDPATVFSSIDHAGRYAYGNQPPVAQWNLARLGEALLPLIAGEGGGNTDGDGSDGSDGSDGNDGNDGNDGSDAAVAAATDVLSGFAPAYRRHFAEGMAAKLGLAEPDPDLGSDLLELLRVQRVDFTAFFRALSAGTARALFAQPEPFDAWAARRTALLPADGAATAAAMDRVNPVHIPRNHLVEEALDAATAGDMAPFHRLLEVVSAPYEQRAGLERYAEPAPAGGAPHVTYCGT